MNRPKNRPWEFHEKAIPPLQPLVESVPRRLFQGLVRDLEEDLNRFDAQVRARALNKLVSLLIPTSEPRAAVNLHTHTFFSYNASGWSPTRYAWEAHKAGLYAAGIIDFDGLDGVGEFLSAAETLSLRGTAGIEVRGFLSEFADLEIDSPGEPGVHYMGGTGFVKLPPAGTPEAAYLQSLKLTSEARSRELIGRINARLPDISIDFDEEVRSRTPAGYATERHFVSAYIAKSREKFPSTAQLADFWSGVLGMGKTTLVSVMAVESAFEEKVRGRLMKRGGLGYVQPGPGTFPPVGEVYAWVKACGGIPMDSWLDGTSSGESRVGELLECNRALGARCLNLIPDRNWNVKDPEEKRIKLENLRKVVSLADSFHMLLHIGTEGNKAGLPFVDDLDGPELSPYKSLFLRGARVLIGHALLARFADMPYEGERSKAEFPKNPQAANAFFESVGALPPLDAAISGRLREAGPERALSAFRDSARRGRWTGIAA